MEVLDVGAELLWREGLRNGAIDFFAKEAENFRDAQVWRKRLCIRDRGHLAAGIQMLCESERTGISVRGDAGAVLLIVFTGKCVLAINDPIKIRARLVSEKICGSC